MERFLLVSHIVSDGRGLGEAGVGWGVKAHPG